MNLTATEALERLRYGNRRFVADMPNSRALAGSERRAQIASAQRPFAIVLGCADSRAPAEILFDQGLGDLFVIRVAGNIVAPSLVGSVEFAADKFATRLVVVMGHTRCGAIEATVDVVANPDRTVSPGIAAIVERIRPSVARLFDGGHVSDAASLRRAAMRLNVMASAAHLRSDSEILARLIADDGLLIVGAEYDVETGLVDFFDGVPQEASPR